MPLFRIRTLATAAAITAASAAVRAHDHSPLPEFLEGGRRAHHCSHDSPALRAMQDADFQAAHTQHVQMRRAGRAFAPQAAARKPIRIKFSTADLFKPGRYCNGTQHAKVSNLQGSMVSCPSDGSEDFTEAKRKFLLNTLLPRTAARFSELLSVEPLQSPINIQSCGRHTVPDEFKTTGAADTDMVIHVGAAPTSRGVVAWAGTCKFDWSSMRPQGGYTNLGPRYIDPDGDLDYQLETVIHELMHSLGFSSRYFGNWGDYQIPTARIARRGTTVTVLKGAAVIREGKTHFGCPSFDGIEVENEGGGGTLGSHLERRLMMQDYMTGVGGPKLSRLTLAVFEDLGFYTANYSAADDTTTFGRNAGCGFFRKKCNTVAGGAGTYFCFQRGRICNGARTGAGYCSLVNFTRALPEHFQYIPGQPTMGGASPLMDFCPVMSVSSNRRCTSTTFQPSFWDKTLGHYFGTGGRCLETVDYAKKPYTAWSSDVTATCTQTRCRGAVLDVKLPVADAEWIECPPGSNVTHPDLNGNIICPPAGPVCSGGAPVSPAPATPVPVAQALITATPEPTPAPAPYTHTVQVTLEADNIDAILAGPKLKRNTYFRSVIKKYRQDLGLPWPTYKAKRTWWKSGGKWTLKIVFTGPNPPPASAARHEHHVASWAAKPQLILVESETTASGSIKPPAELWVTSDDTPEQPAAGVAGDDIE